MLSQLGQALQDNLGAGAANAATPADGQQNSNSGSNSNSNPFEQLIQIFTAGAASAQATNTANKGNNLPDPMEAALKDIMNILGSAQATVQNAMPAPPSHTTDNNASNNALSGVSSVAAGTNAQQTTSSGFVTPANSTPQANSAILDQVFVQIKSSAATGANQIKIELAPESLGKVEVQMVTGTDGKTGITITADSRQTLAVLQSEARSLESALRDIGLKTDAGGLNFNLRGDGQQQNQQNSNAKGGVAPRVAWRIGGAKTIQPSLARFLHHTHYPCSKGWT